jgi:hypothetical protein
VSRGLGNWQRRILAALEEHPNMCGATIGGDKVVLLLPGVVVRGSTIRRLSVESEIYKSIPAPFNRNHSFLSP